MQKFCARCSKQVYQTEEINCLDKFWHRGCFKCTVCGMPLTMNSYKGYGKMPYCSVHYPTQKHTVVVDNPEMERLRKNTMNQSNVKYHEKFEKSRGRYTILPDDPDTKRNINNQRMVSQVEYKGKTKSLASQSQDSEYADKPSQDVHPSQTTSGSISSPTLSNSSQSKEPSVLKISSKKDKHFNVGSIADYDPLSGDYGSLTKGYRPKCNDSSPYNPEIGFSTYIPDNPYQESTGVNDVLNQNNCCDALELSGQRHSFDVQAIYDYYASDMDELSFKQGDVILGCEFIDSGWMIGTHSKSRQSGMLPANYVRPIE